MDFMKLDGFSDKAGFIKVNSVTMYHIVGRNEDGFADIGQQSPVPDEMRVFSMIVLISRLMGFIKW